MFRVFGRVVEFWGTEGLRSLFFYVSGLSLLSTFWVASFARLLGLRFFEVSDLYRTQTGFLKGSYCPKLKIPLLGMWRSHGGFLRASDPFVLL